MQKLSIDIETYSDVDLTKCGVYAYVNSPNFEILLFAYSIDDGETEIIDLANGEQLLPEIVSALTSPNVIKTAFNAQFERICISKHLGFTLNPEQWYCTAVQAAELSLPNTLADVGTVLGLDKQKMTEGKELIKYFCVPCMPTKSNGGRTRNRPHNAPEKWDLFKTYCIRDVDVERQIAERLKAYPISKSEHDLYLLDQRINDRGVKVDLDFAYKAIEMNKTQTAIATEQAYALTGLENPNSVTQLKQWLSERGIKIDSLSKKAVESLSETLNGDTKEILRLRLLMSKTSVKKYEAVVRSVCSDGRVHGMMRFYGANRTGRWAGAILQPQNLPQNHLPDLAAAKNAVKYGDIETVDMIYGNVPNVLSELIRTVLVPKEGCRFIVADFSAIEARVLSWIAGEMWRIKTFKEGGDIYCASASQMFHVPVVKHGENRHLRQKGKIAELACGYGGGVGALKSMGALDMGIAENELQSIIDDWRGANPNIVKLWYEVGNAAIRVIKEKSIEKVRNLTFKYESGILFIALPGGRQLSYVKPKIGINRFGGESITYMGLTQAKKWGRLETFGGKLVENIIQAIARDLLAAAMMNVTAAGYDIVFHVHDEIIAEVPNDKGSVDEMCGLMSVCPDWAAGLPLKADGYECDFYRKD